MGLFKKMFGKKQQESSTDKSSKAHSPTPEWDFYFSHIDNVIGSFFVDLSLIHVAPISNKPNLVWVSVTMNNPREDGLSSTDEFESLTQIENRLNRLMIAKHNAVYAGRLTTNRRRDFYYYMGNTSHHDKTISDAMEAFPAYTFDVGKKEDQQWELYLNFMYPNPSQHQGILNRRVVDSLKNRGDLLTKARPVDHWIFFKTEADKGKYLSAIQDDGFTIVDNDCDTEFGQAPYRLRISRIDKVDHDSVDDYAIRLWRLAEECNGEYDGWETSVERE